MYKTSHQETRPKSDIYTPKEAISKKEYYSMAHSDLHLEKTQTPITNSFCKSKLSVIFYFSLVTILLLIANTTSTMFTSRNNKTEEKAEKKVKQTLMDHFHRSSSNHRQRNQDLSSSDSDSSRPPTPPSKRAQFTKSSNSADHTSAQPKARPRPRNRKASQTPLEPVNKLKSPPGSDKHDPDAYVSEDYSSLMSNLPLTKKENEPQHELPTARLTRSQSLKAATVKPSNLKDHPRENQNSPSDHDVDNGDTNHQLHYSRRPPTTTKIISNLQHERSLPDDQISSIPIYTENTQEDTPDTQNEYDDHNNPLSTFCLLDINNLQQSPPSSIPQTPISTYQVSEIPCFKHKNIPDNIKTPVLTNQT